MADQTKIKDNPCVICEDLRQKLAQAEVHNSIVSWGELNSNKQLQLLAKEAIVDFRKAIMAINTHAAIGDRNGTDRGYRHYS